MQKGTATIRRGDLTLVPPPARVIPTTPCPPWCVVPHDQPGHDGDFHYGPHADIAGITICPEILETGEHVACLRADRADGEYLDIEEIDRLIDALASARAMLTGGAR